MAHAEQVYETEMPEDDPVPYLRAATDPGTTDPEQRIKTAGLLGLSVHPYANKTKITKTADKRIRERYTEFKDGLRTGYTGLYRFITEIGFRPRASRGWTTPPRRSSVPCAGTRAGDYRGGAQP